MTWRLVSTGGLGIGLAWLGYIMSGFGMAFFVSVGWCLGPASVLGIILKC